MSSSDEADGLLSESDDELGVSEIQESSSLSSQASSSSSSSLSSSLSRNRELLSVDELKGTTSREKIVENIKKHVYSTSGLQWMWYENKICDADETLAQTRFIRIPTTENEEQLLNNTELTRMFQDNRHFVPVFDIFSFFIPSSAFAGAAKNLADIDCSDDVGYGTAAAFVSLCKAFSDNSQGFSNTVKMGDMYVRDTPSTCEAFGITYPKGRVVFEILVHEAPETESSSAFLRNIEDVFEHDNIAGARIWFLVSDPWFKINQSIYKVIKENSDFLGESQRLQELTSNDSLAVQQRAMLFEDNSILYARAEKRVNRDVRLFNQKLDENRQNTKNVVFSSPLTIYKNITNAAIYHNIVIAPYLGIPKIAPGTAKWNNLAILTNDQQNERDVISVYNTYALGNRNIQHRLFSYGVHSSQATDSTYIHEFDSLGYEIGNVEISEFIVPYPEICFSGNRSQFKPEGLATLGLPWSFDMAQLVLTCLTALASDKNEEFYAQIDLERAERIRNNAGRFQFLEQINIHRQNQLAREPGLLARQDIEGTRFEPESLSNAYFSCYGSSAKRFGNFDPNMDTERNIVSIKTNLEIARDAYLEQYRAYNNFESNIDIEARRFILEKLIRRSGRNRMRKVMTVSEENTTVFNAATRRLRAIIARKGTVFYELPMLEDIGITGSIMAGDLDTLTKVFGLSHGDVMYDILNACYRATSDNVFEEAMGFPGMIVHIAVVGAPGTGKTHDVTKVLSKLLLGGTQEAVGTSSACAAHVPKATWGNAQFIDEYPSWMIPFDKSAEQQRSTMKKILSEGTADRKVLVLPESTVSGREQAMQREACNIRTKVRATYLITSNRWDKQLENGDTSLADRFMVNTVLAPSSSTTSTSGMEMVRAQLPTSIQNGREIMALRNQREEMYNDRHALTVWLNVAIICGNIPPPNIDLFVVLWRRVIDDLSQVVPSIFSNTRSLGAQPVSIALSRAIADSIGIVTNSMASPLLYDNLETGRLEVSKFSLDMAPLFSVFMFLSQRSSIWLITRLVNTYIINEKCHQAAEALASMCCNYFTPAKRATFANGGAPSNFGEPIKYAVYEQSRFIDMGVLEFVASENEVIDILCNKSGLGHTRDSAKNILTDLKNMTVHCPRAVFDHGDPNQTRANQGVKETINVLVKKENKVGFGAEVQCTWYLSIYFLALLSPTQVLKRVMKAVTVKGIRPGKMLFGKPVPGHKSYWAGCEITEQAARTATEEISFGKKKTTNAADKRFFRPNARYSFTQETRNQSQQFKQDSEESVLDLDETDDPALGLLESRMHIHWLMKDHFLTLAESKNFSHIMTERLALNAQKCFVDENDPLTNLKYPEGFIHYERMMARNGRTESESAPSSQKEDEEYEREVLHQLPTAIENLNKNPSAPASSSSSTAVVPHISEEAQYEATAEQMQAFFELAQTNMVQPSSTGQKRTYSSSASNAHEANKRQRQRGSFGASDPSLASN